MHSPNPDTQPRLILRLPNDDTQPLWWYFRSAVHPQQGYLAPGEQDDNLAKLIATYPAYVLLPASEFVFHRVTLPRNARRQGLQVLPFMLEEQLATDVEQLHFAILHQSGDDCEVAVVEKRHMQQWINRCRQQGVRVQVMIPDVLMLPLVTHGWSAVSLNEQWLFRREKYAGMMVESSWLPEFLAGWPPLIIESYSPPPIPKVGPAEWREHPPRHLLQLAAEGEPYRGADLRQGEFTRSTPWCSRLRPWRWVMIAFIGYLVLLCFGAGLSHYRLWQQAEHWRKESVRFYQQLFPTEKNVVNPRAQMQQHLQQLQPAQLAGISVQMHQLQQLVAEDSAIRFQAISYDTNRQELKIEVHATSFQALEQFQTRAREFYRVQPGEIKHNLGGVESRLTLGINNSGGQP